MICKKPALELELSPEQRGLMNDRVKEMNAIQSDYMGVAIGLMSDPEGLAEAKANLEQKIDTVVVKLFKDLLPHQQKRLAQLFRRFGAYVQDRNAKHLLLAKSTQKLGLTSDQKKRVENVAEQHQSEVAELVKKYKAELRRLSKEHDSEMLELLTDKQRKSFIDSFGPEFSFRESFTQPVGSSRD